MRSRGAVFHTGPERVFSLFSGRNALHLAAKYGHALCLQKLLQVLKNPTCLCLLF